MISKRQTIAKITQRLKSSHLLWVIVPVISVSVLGLSLVSGLNRPVLQQSAARHVRFPSKATNPQKVSKASPVASTNPVPAPPPTAKPATSVNTSSAKPSVVVPSPSSSVNNLTPTSTGQASSGSSGASSSTTISYSSTNWSGYMAASGSFSQVSASWTAPRATGIGGTTSADATWIGIGGVTTGDLIQVGTENTISPSGQVSTAAFYELLPSASQTISRIAVAAGDSISASLVQTAAGHWTISITDETNGQSYTTSVAYGSSGSSAEWIEEDPSYYSGRLIPFDDFGSVSFTGGSTIVGGKSVTIAGSGAQSITLVNNAGRAIATPSGLVGGSFSVIHD